MSSSDKQSAGGKAVAHSSSAYISALEEADVLLGRGAPVRKREANQSYYELVKGEKQAYNATGKHALKDQIARTIVDKVASKGGRFVRRVETDDERMALGIPNHVAEAWVVVSEDSAREKCKQSLRDAAASLKKPPAATSSRKRKTIPKPGEVEPASEVRCSSSTDALQSLHLRTAERIQQPNPAQETEKQAPKPSTTKVELPQSLQEPPSSAAIFSRAEGATLDNSQELSYRLKHPSHRKRDLLRLRRMQEQLRAAALPEASLLTDSLMKADRGSEFSVKKCAVGPSKELQSTCSDEEHDQKPKSSTKK